DGIESDEHGHKHEESELCFEQTIGAQKSRRFLPTPTPLPQTLCRPSRGAMMCFSTCFGGSRPTDSFSLSGPQFVYVRRFPRRRLESLGLQLRFGKHLKLAYARPGICSDALQKPLIMPLHALDRSLVEQIAVVYPGPSQSVCRFIHQHDQIVLYDLVIERQRTQG